MQRDRIATARSWLDNAGTDASVAEEVLQRYPSRACFHAQQCSELALKAALIALADDHPRSHVADHLIGELRTVVDGDIPPEVVVSANRLDLFYTGSRYPDALGGADPLKVLQIPDAVAALAQARTVLAFATDVVDRLERDGSTKVP